MGIFLQVTYERLLQSTGKTFFNMLTQRGVSKVGEVNTALSDAANFKSKMTVDDKENVFDLEYSVDDF